MTEVDVYCSTCGWDSNARQTQGKVFGQLLRICLTEPNCKAFVSWGYTDKIAWDKNAHGLPFDSNINPKPGYWSMLYQLNANQGSGRSSSLIEVENLVQTGNLTEVEVNDDTAEQEEFFELENEANSLKYIY